MSGLPVLEAGQSWACGSGCGYCTPKESALEYSREEFPDGRVISKTQRVFVSACCGEDLLLWDENKQDFLPWPAPHAVKTVAPAAPKPKRAYISGPMTGIADLNAPAFAAEAARLLALGYQVENPADVVLPEGATWADFMRADIPRLLACSHIRMLGGWTMSKGARLEHHIAISLGLEVLTDCDLKGAVP